ncbi:MAG: glycosyl hydrolase family 28 protein, partial [Verrucomicrobiota bacterium]
ISQDDNIALKSGRNQEGRKVGRPTYNVWVEDCQFFDGFGLALGSEMSGGIHQVTFKDCVLTNCATLALIKSYRGRGGLISDVTFEGIRYTNKTQFPDWYQIWTPAPITLNCFYSERTPDYQTPREVDSGTPTIRNILFRDITISDSMNRKSIQMIGLPERPAKHISFDRVHVETKQPVFGANVSVEQSNIQGPPESAIVWEPSFKNKQESK